MRAKCYITEKPEVLFLIRSGVPFIKKISLRGNL